MNVPRVKICGITRVQDALTAANAGADAIGLVFYPPSSRYLKETPLAREIARSVGPFVCVTALFVNATANEIEAVLKQVPVNLIQFHGDENNSFCEGFGLPFIKALRVQDKGSLEIALNNYPDAAGILLDAYVAGMPGGTGEKFNWELVPQDLAQPIILAGGLNPQNIAAAVRQTRIYGVDVSGGVESAPGIKSPELVKQFISNAKSIGED